MLRLRTEVAIDAGKIQQFYHHEQNLDSPDVRARRTYRQCWSAIHDILHASRQGSSDLSWPRISSGSGQASRGEVTVSASGRKGSIPCGSTEHLQDPLSYNSALIQKNFVRPHRKCPASDQPSAIMRTTDCTNFV